VWFSQSDYQCYHVSSISCKDKTLWWTSFWHFYRLKSKFQPIVRHHVSKACKIALEIGFYMELEKFMYKSIIIFWCSLLVLLDYLSNIAIFEVACLFVFALPSVICQVTNILIMKYSLTTVVIDLSIFIYLTRQHWATAGCSSNDDLGLTFYFSPYLA
jgi:hypothetical protein